MTDQKDDVTPPASETKADPSDQNEIVVKIEGEEVTLKPTYGAARLISSRYGGTNAVIERVLKVDIDLIADIIAIGAGYTGTRRPPPDFAERVWRSGISDDTGRIAEQCIRFLSALARGGKVPPPLPEFSGGETEEPADPR